MKLVTPLNESGPGVAIIVVGANPLYRKGLELVLNGQPRSKGESSFFLHGCSTVEDFEADLSDLSEPQQQSVIILLLDEGGEPASTIKNIDTLKKVNPLSKIIVISNSTNVDYINRCIEKGVHAYIPWDISDGCPEGCPRSNGWDAALVLRSNHVCSRL